MGLLDNLSGRLENLRSDNKLHQSGDINAAQVALRTAGETIGGIGDVAMAPIAPLVPEFVKEGFSDLMGGVLSTGPAKTAMAWAKKNPEQARDVMSALNASALLPGGAMLSAGKKAVTYGPQATKGAGLSNISNYINNRYGPGKDFAGTPAEAAAKKAAGFTETAGKGLLGIVGHAVSPKSKALYGEQGITVPAQKIVQGHLDNMPTDTRALSKGVGQVQYGKHINAQSGRQGGTNAAADEIANRSFLQQHTPNTPGSIQQALNQHGVGMDDLIDTRKKKLESGAKEWRSLPNVPANPNDSRFVEKYLNDVMKFDQFVVKSPSNVQTGGHYSDIMHKNPAGAEIKAAFNLKKAPRNPDGTVDINAVAQRLLSRQGEANKKLPKGSAWRVVTKDPESIAQNGLWLRGSKVGSSITEGGVGWLMKVEPDGTLTGYMFDKHDFLEKVPGVNIAAQKLLPNDVIAVTPAMKTQIKVPGVKGKHFKQTPQNVGTTDTMEALLQQYATAAPSKQNLRGEQMQMGGRALQMGGLLGASENR